MQPGRKINVTAVLKYLPASAPQLANRMGCVRSTADLRLKHLHKLGLVRIGRWVRTTGWPLPVFVAGAGEDAPRPRRRTNAEVIAKCKRKKKKERALRDAEKRLALAQNVIPTKPQSIFSALGL